VERARLGVRCVPRVRQGVSQGQCWDRSVGGTTRSHCRRVTYECTSAVSFSTVHKKKYSVSRGAGRTIQYVHVRARIVVLVGTGHYSRTGTAVLEYEILWYGQGKSS
jgi:hypothetical protein